MCSLKRGLATASGSKTSRLFLKSNPPEQWWYAKILRFIQEVAGGEGGLHRQGRAQVNHVSIKVLQDRGFELHRADTQYFHTQGAL